MQRIVPMEQSNTPLASPSAFKAMLIVEIYSAYNEDYTQQNEAEAKIDRAGLPRG